MTYIFLLSYVTDDFRPQTIVNLHCWVLGFVLANNWVTWDQFLKVKLCQDEFSLALTWSLRWYSSEDSTWCLVNYISLLWLVAQLVKKLPAMQETWVWFLGQEDHLEQELATHTSIIAWKIPWTKDSGGLQSMVSRESDTNYQLNHCQPASSDWVGSLFILRPCKLPDSSFVGLVEC